MPKRPCKNKTITLQLSPSPWIYFLFLFSGIAGLIYQVVWVRMLTLVFGHTIYSVSIVLSAFMAGLGLGSYLWGRTIDKTGKPLLIYGKIEILIGVSAALLSMLLSNFSPVYAWLHQLLPDLLFLAAILKTVLAFLFVLIPTIFMGATLPIICKYFVIDDSNLGQQVGYLYSINTLGAAVGCLFAGFFLIGFLGVLETALLAAGINLLIGLVCIFVFKKTEPGVTCGFGLPKPVFFHLKLDKEDSLWLVISFFCGFTALAYEVVWTRLLVFGMGSTVYSFSLMLANFLIGITVGSLLIVPFFKRKINFRLLLAIFQFGVGLYITLSLYQSSWILSSFIRPFQWDTEFSTNMRNASALMFVPTVLFGMSFPVLTYLVTKSSKNIGTSLGVVYGVNTLGAIMGSIIAGYLLLPNLGSQQTLVCLAMLNFLSGILLYATSSLFTGFIRKGVTIFLSCLLLLFLLQMPNDLLKEIFLRDSYGKKNPEQLIYLKEGLTTTVAVFDDDRSGVKSKRLVLNGVTMSGDAMSSRKYMTLLSYIPLLLTENPKNVLVICFGTGLTAGAAGVYPGINLVDVIDISPGVFRAGKFFNGTNHNVVNNPKVKKIIQDGRQHLLTTSTTYDVITAEPPPPMSAGSVNLYTKEYYELTKRALKPGGIVSQWIPLLSQSETHVYQHFQTFLESFPYTMAWYPVRQHLILIGSERPIDINFSQIERYFENPVVNKIMRDIDFPDPFSFLGSIWFLRKELKNLSSQQHVISDNNPSLEFYLNYPKVISRDDIYKIIARRAPFEEVWAQVTEASLVTTSRNICGVGRACTGSTISDVVLTKDTLKKHWGSRRKADEASIHNNLGTALFAERKVEEAISHYKRAIQLNSDWALAHYNLGTALFAERKIEEAISHYKTSIKLNPSWAKAHDKLGSALFAERKVEEAITHFKTAIKLDPGFAEAYNNLGGTLLNTKMTEETIVYFKEAIRIKPDFDKAHYNLATALSIERKNKESITHYKVAIKLNPEWALAHYSLGNALFAEQKNEEAIAHYKAAIKLKPEFLSIAQSNLEEAISKIEK
jgi:spermidine synthase